MQHALDYRCDSSKRLSHGAVDEAKNHDTENMKEGCTQASVLCLFETKSRTKTCIAYLPRHCWATPRIATWTPAGVVTKACVCPQTAAAAEDTRKDIELAVDHPPQHGWIHADKKNENERTRPPTPTTLQQFGLLVTRSAVPPPSKTTRTHAPNEHSKMVCASYDEGVSEAFLGTSVADRESDPPCQSLRSAIELLAARVGCRVHPNATHTYILSKPLTLAKVI